MEKHCNSVLATSTKRIGTPGSDALARFTLYVHQADSPGSSQDLHTRVGSNLKVSRTPVPRQPSASRISCSRKPSLVDSKTSRNLVTDSHSTPSRRSLLVKDPNNAFSRRSLLVKDSPNTTLSSILFFGNTAKAESVKNLTGTKIKARRGSLVEDTQKPPTGRGRRASKTNGNKAARRGYSARGERATLRLNEEEKARLAAPQVRNTPTPARSLPSLVGTGQEDNPERKFPLSRSSLACHSSPHSVSSPNSQEAATPRTQRYSVHAVLNAPDENDNLYKAGKRASLPQSIGIFSTERFVVRRVKPNSVRLVGTKPCEEKCDDGLFWIKPEDVKSFKKVKKEAKKALPGFVDRQSLISMRRKQAYGQ